MRRLRRWLVPALLAGVVGGLAWRSWAPASLPVPQAVARPPESASTAAPLPLAPRAASQPAALASAAVSAPATRAALPADETVEVCGLGRLSRQEVEAWSPADQARADQKLQALGQRRDAVFSRMSARLAVGSERDQVVARLLMQDAQGAAELAARSRDAAAYRLALQACSDPRAAERAPACAALTTQAWAALAPEDGRPWLRLMGEAAARRDEAAATAALEQVLARPSLSAGRPLLLAFAEARAAAGDPQGLGLALVEIIGREAAQSGPSVFGQGRHCSEAAVKDATRHARCERLARWLLPRADDLLSALLASGIADRVGIPAAQRPYTREQLRRGQEALVDQSMVDLRMDCAGLAHMGEVWTTRFVQHNELQQALQAAAAAR